MILLTGTRSITWGKMAYRCIIYSWFEKWELSFARSDPEPFKRVRVWLFHPDIAETDRRENESCSSDFVSTANKTQGQSSSSKVDVVCSLMYCSSSSSSNIRNFVVLPANTNSKYTNIAIPANPACTFQVKSHQQHHLCWKLNIAFTSLHSHWLAEGCVDFSLVCNAFVSCCFFFFFSLSVSTSWVLMCETNLAAGTMEFILNHVIL